MKICSKCGDEKSLDEFYIDRGRRDGRHSSCIACHKAYNKANLDKRKAARQKWREANIEAERAKARARAKTNGWAHRLKRKYGLTPSDYSRILSDQMGLCANPGCFNSPADQRFHVDHDHACCPSDLTCGKCIRGLLCRPCNQALGNANDDVKRLRGLADYLEKLQGVN